MLQTGIKEHTGKRTGKKSFQASFVYSYRRADGSMQTAIRTRTSKTRELAQKWLDAQHAPIKCTCEFCTKLEQR